MFQFSGFASFAGYHIFNMVGCPIRISTDQLVCAHPRSFSQLITSFIASESLGIPHTLLCSLLYILSFNEFAISPWLVNQNWLRVTMISSEENICNIFYVSFFNMSMNVAVSNLIGDPISAYFQLNWQQSQWDSRFHGNFGGEYRSRTDDLLRARQAL